MFAVVDFDTIPGGAHPPVAREPPASTGEAGGYLATGGWVASSKRYSYPVGRLVWNMQLETMATEAISLEQLDKLH